MTSNTNRAREGAGGKIMTETLKPCPLCGAPMQFRKALWTSDGDTDAVIHNVDGGSKCGLVDFSIGATDEVSTIAAWNTRAVETALREALTWYSERAVAAERYMADAEHTEALLAVLTELALDGGKRALAAYRAQENGK